MSKDCCCEEDDACCSEEEDACCDAHACCCGEECDEVVSVTSRLSFRDMLGSWKARWGIGRMAYTVAPGLYALGNPDDASPVLVSANYKLTFDSLRQALPGVDCWLLILDTKGINVWCAAGKGTFGTDELTARLEKTGLAEKVRHRQLIVPQCGAVGVCAHEVRRRTGFTVLYGPVRAEDIRAYLAAGCQATEAMRTVRFTFWDRLVLVPMEFAPAMKKLLPAFGALFILNLFADNPFGLSAAIAWIGAVVAGTVLTPLLLPFLPGRMFAGKGGIAGLAWALCLVWACAPDWLSAIGYLLALPALSAYLAMQFTGSSTYTSFSGVIKEMRTALPPIALSFAAGVVLLLSHAFLG